MRIAILTSFYPPQIGGIQVLLETVSQGLSKRWNHSVFVITRTWPDTPNQEEIQGVSIIRLPSLNKNQPMALGHALWQILRTHQIDLLICVEPRLRWALPSSLITWMLRIPMLLLLAGTYSEASHPISRWFAGLGAKKIIGISRYALQQYGWWSSRWHLVYCGVDANSLPPPTNYKERKDMVLTVARINPRKNLNMVIRVAHLLPQYQFVIVGEDGGRLDYFEPLQKLVKKLEVKNVIFTGKVSNETRNRFYREAKLFFLPTRHEMFGIVFVEAMAAGLPIVATNITAVPEVVNSKVGRLLSLASPPEAFAQEIEMLMTDRETWSILSVNATQRANAFQWDKTIQSYAEICVQVVSKKRPLFNREK